MRWPAVTCPTGKVCLTFAQADAIARHQSREYSKPITHYHCSLCGYRHTGAAIRMPRPLPIINTNHSMRLT